MFSMSATPFHTPCPGLMGSARANFIISLFYYLHLLFYCFTIYIYDFIICIIFIILFQTRSRRREYGSSRGES